MTEEQEVLVPCIELKLNGRTIDIHAFSWKTDRHNRVRFDAWEGESVLLANTSDTDVVGFLVKEILAALASVVPAAEGAV